LIRPDHVAEMKAHADDVLPPQIAAVVNGVAQPLLQAITDMESDQLAFGRVAILGDAAFIARPHSAAGVTKAALDAQTLADSLLAAQHDVSPALAAYQSARLDFGRRLVAHARYLGAYLEGRIKPPMDRRGHERERDPRQIMQDYGAPHLLHDVDTAPFRTPRTGVGVTAP
jgi:2-polyprenyl-6-methoxyphenol hydroxylase-like FAD-dependent oxidoreductase